MSITELPKIKNLENAEIKVPDKCGMLNLPDGLPTGFFSLLPRECRRACRSLCKR